ncbi:MAG: geranylgeranylglycerol-phosphate geranylgeranyltransferase [Chitinivibrionia bacterium]|nr:geranylgeranylglycerol-phosphate geranylgeranyltransferase [Chitinivibrionia bacterium]
MACIASGYLLAGGAPFSGAVSPMIFTGLAAGCGNMINDYFDADIDRINKPRRPIPSGRLSPPAALFLYGAGTAAVTAAALYALAPRMAAFVLAWEVLLFIYARFLKRTGLPGNVLVACVASSAFVAGALIAGDPVRAAFPVLFAFLFIMGRELVKDAEDLEGDRSAGAKTIAVVFGLDRTLCGASAFLLACACIAPIPCLAGAFGKPYGLVMELAVVPGLLAASALILGKPTRPLLTAVSWILKGEMFLGILAMGFA